MKKNMIVGIALALGILTVGALSASAAEPCGKCTEQQAVQQYKQETAALNSAMKAKDLQLRELNTYDSIDIHKVNAIEAELKGLKDKIDAAAEKYGISACSRS